MGSVVAVVVVAIVAVVVVAIVVVAIVVVAVVVVTVVVVKSQSFAPMLHPLEQGFLKSQDEKKKHWLWN